MIRAQEKRKICYEEIKWKEGLGGIQMIDPNIDYLENKANVESQMHKRLFLKPEKRRAEEEEKRIKAVVEAYEEMGPISC